MLFYESPARCRGNSGYIVHVKAEWRLRCAERVEAQHTNIRFSVCGLLRQSDLHSYYDIMRLQKDFYHQRCLRHEGGKEVQTVTYASFSSTLFYHVQSTRDGLDDINLSNSISQLCECLSFRSFHFASNECYCKKKKCILLFLIV